MYRSTGIDYSLAGKLCGVMQPDMLLKPFVEHFKQQYGVEAQKEFERMKGIFRGKQRKALQKIIEELSTQISGMKQHLSNMVKDYGYKNMKEFLKGYNATKADYGSYQEAVKVWKTVRIRSPSQSVHLKDWKLTSKE